jgi:hypothetical protein
MAPSAPHNHIKTSDAREAFLLELFDSLWGRYRGRMEYVRRYEAVVAQHGATFVNDHVAFRTIAWQSPAAGIFSISRIFEALGYIAAATYEFPDKHFSSIHYQHLHPQFPKLFITQLKPWELSDASQKIITKSLKKQQKPLAEGVLTALQRLDGESAAARQKLLNLLMDYFAALPWPLPEKKDVLALNEESQFGAWVLVNGYDVNHFTASVDSHGVASLDDIEKVVEVLRAAGVPMKQDIEGARGTKLRQTSTDAVVIEVPVKDGGKKKMLKWTYAYFEIAQRPDIINPATGRAEKFQGFLGGQATNLFDMTKKK